jgi:hypothetical protein
VASRRERDTEGLDGEVISTFGVLASRMQG